MNYETLFQDLQNRTIRIALTGANGGFGRSLLVQCRHIKAIQIAALCDLDLDATRTVLLSLGYPAENLVTCNDAHAVQAANAQGRIALVSDYRLLDAATLDIVVEATGNPDISAQIAVNAIRRGVHVAMVSKETDAVVGPYLNRLALEHKVVYTTADGDQPSNLIGLVTWARVLGFEVVAAGKSSEYDYVYDPASGALAYTDQQHQIPALSDLLSLGQDVPARLQERRQAISALPQSATPDYCEMNVVANSTGLTPACDALSYPLCRIAELADIFVPRADGGILDREGVVDVFNCLRLPEEASFGGGVFVVVRCTDSEVWETLRQKGHVVGRNGKYACIYLPYHLMGLETPISLFSAVLHGRPSGSATQEVHAVMAAQTQRQFKAGEVLAMRGHHHNIDGLKPLLLPAKEAHGVHAPFYLAANRTLRVDVPAGAIIGLDMLELSDTPLHNAWKQLDKS
ncbi:NAD(P)H-dependent oxidoreductase [Herbaspirillum sp. alder98]|uniref:NAD(P)H-dependent oxidoreductase n=1 Tax=Herbaspirillum sp. alder98 TaxID=2913096 RepID=UPI001CD8ECEB|nr:homoserine dehydrogenase [Herbaspirillum sp. alder98]MCA1326377.1 homoserine dehydrogenase [Herbaspirillum sp. alder98]